MEDKSKDKVKREHKKAHPTGGFRGIKMMGIQICAAWFGL